MILVSKTYEIVTEESAANGEAAESGFVFEDGVYTFRELVTMMQDYSESSGGHIPWFTSYPEQNYRTGEWESESIHFSRNNPSKNLKYWLWAAKAAGLLK